MIYTFVIAATDGTQAVDEVSDILGGDDDITTCERTGDNRYTVKAEVDTGDIYAPSLEGRLNKLINETSALVWWNKKEA